MRAQISAKLKGRPSANFGRPKSEMHRAKLAAANIGKKASEETRVKMRAAQALRPPRSDETKAKQSAAMKGRVHSEAARHAISIAKRGKPGRKLTDAERCALRAHSVGRVISEETREKLRQAKLGKPGPWTGKKRGPQSEQWRKAIGESNVGKTVTPEVREKLRLANLGKKHSAETRRRIKAAVADKGRRGPANNRWGKPPPHGLRIEYAGIIFRSTYEVAFAKALDRDGIEWQYEHHRFDLGRCTYLPDFYLPDAQTYWEVKGYLGPDSIAKIDLFRKTFPEVPLIVATKPVLQMIGAL